MQTSQNPQMHESIEVGSSVVGDDYYRDVGVQRRMTQHDVGAGESERRYLKDASAQMHTSQTDVSA